ncbi:HvfC family RiPP maturation protein [Alteromonas sp. a30]|uniref:HvfC family RiPP maturation protein n=1 Tax=Alteromonas sp. a30 TaxID=2730917 RepID=UPI00227EF26C|nr:putative DNA-binding domain-containing protein [Alteromonas sp. a30]MCY7297474.1 DUF2063 domain-containing protein [Alteromonas sp. a30]
MSSLHTIQNQFADHIRNPDMNAPVEGLEDKRLNVYRELFFNNVLGFLETGFPVLKSLFEEERWKKLARTFFSEHECRSPYFVDISKEFVEFLSNEYQKLGDEPIFMEELAHYEWIELALSIRKQENNIECWDGESPVSSIILSELAELLSYQYPVHQISPDFQPQESQKTTYLVVHRNTEDEVNFTEVNDITAHLLHQVKTNEKVLVSSLIEDMCDAMPQISKDQVAAGATQIIQQMLVAQILLPA